MKTGINMKNKVFKAENNEYHNGFHMTFENGCTISVQFGRYNYCNEGETTAEVAAWDNQDNWLMFDGEKWSEVENGSDVISHQTTGDVAKLIYTLSQW
jgi:hypothetical protein